MTLAEINDELGAARTNKKEFLGKLEAIIPWETFLELIQPSYYKGELGDKPYGDSGYIGANKRPEAIKKNKNGKKIKYLINRRPSSIKKLSKSGQYAAKKKEHQKSSVRCKVEHVFAVIKNIFRYRKTRYRGLRKQTAKLNIMFALANLYLADRKSLTV